MTRTGGPDSGATPAVVEQYRAELTSGEDVIDPATWVGSLPSGRGIAPRVRVGRSRWFNLLWLVPIAFVLLLVAIAAAKGLRTVPAVQRFIARNPGVAGSTPDRLSDCRSGWGSSTSSTCS